MTPSALRLIFTVSMSLRLPSWSAQSAGTLVREKLNKLILKFKNLEGFF